MALNANIPLQAKGFEVPSSVNALAQMLQLDGAATGNALQQAQLAQVRDAQARDGEFRNALAGGADEQALMRIDPAKAAQIVKAKAEQASAAQVMQERQFKMAREKSQAILDLIGSAKDQASYDMARQQGQALGLTFNGPEQFDPAFVAQAGQMALSQMQRLDQIAKERGFQLTERGQNLTAETSRRGQDISAASSAASRAQAERQFNLSREDALRAREVKDAAKPPTPADVKVTEAKDALSLLSQAEKLLGAATGSYAGKVIDQGARVFGASTKGAEAAAELKALEGALIAKMPKMSGPQSDKDVLLYKQMAGQIGDDTLPADTKRAAIRTIREIQNRYAGNTGTPDAPAAPADPTGGWDAAKRARYEAWKAQKK